MSGLSDVLRSFSCDHCGVEFNTAASLNRHKEKFCSATNPLFGRDPSQQIEKKADRRPEKLGDMTLGELKSRLQTNTDNLQLLGMSVADKKIHQLRELKIQQRQATNDREARERALLNTLEKIQADMQVGIVKEQARSLYQTMNRDGLQAVTNTKEAELESASKEYESLALEEKRVLEEIEKLKKNVLELPAERNPEKEGQKESKTMAVKNERRRSEIRAMDEEHQRRIEVIREEKRQLEERKADVLARLEENRVDPHDFSSSDIEQLRLELSRGKSRLQRLKDQLKDDEQQVRRFDIESNTVKSPSLIVDDDDRRPVSRSSIESDNTSISSLPVRKVQARVQRHASAGEAYSLRRRLKKIERKLEAGHGQYVMPAINPTVPNIQATMMWKQLQQLEADNERLRRNMAFGRDRVDGVDSDLRDLQADQMKEILILKHKVEVARQHGELRRLEMEMESHRLKLATDQIAAVRAPLIQNVNADSALVVNPLLSNFYNAEEGLVVFWDFVVGLDATVNRARLTTALYNGKKEITEATEPVPFVSCSPVTAYPTFQSLPGNVGVFQGKQQIMGCSPSPTYHMLVQLHGGGVAKRSSASRLLTSAATVVPIPIGWTKVNLFDSQLRLLCGQWRVPLRSTPAVPDISVARLNLLEKAGGAELYYRIANGRDKESQSKINVNPLEHAHVYKIPPSFSAGPPHLVADAIVTAPIVVSGEGNADVTRVQTTESAGRDDGDDGSVEEKSPSPPPRPAVTTNVAFRVDWVRRVGWGEARVNLTVYDASRTIVKAESGAELLWSTGKIRSNFLEGVHEFRIRSPVFDQVQLDDDSVLIIDFWLGKRRRINPNRLQSNADDERAVVDDDDDDDDDYEQDVEEEFDDNAQRKNIQIIYDDETLVGWTAMTIVVPDTNEDPDADGNETSDRIKLKTGAYRLPLFDVVDRPDIHNLVVPILDSDEQPYTLLADAEIKFEIGDDDFAKTRRPTTATSEFFDESRPSSPLAGCWIAKERTEIPWLPFVAGDGFDLHIDGARFLPDIVTATRVSGRIMNYKYNKVGEKLDISTDIDLDSNVYEPRYNFFLFVREERVPPTSTLILRIYTRNRWTKELTIIGYSVLAIFVESGTDRQPGTDSSGIQVSLNEGAHQLRIHSSLPKLSKPMNAAFLDDEPALPCASLLVRLAANSNDAVTSSSPQYNEGVYYSMACRPQAGEIRLFGPLANRPSLLVRQVMTTIGDGSEKRLTTDEGRRQWIKKRLWRYFEDTPADMDLTYVAKYTPASGIGFSVDSAQNLPWSKMTRVLYSFAPPASYYSGKADDPIRYVRHLDWDSSLQAPSWTDGFQFFGRRRLHRHLAVIVHLVAIDFSGRKGKLKIIDEAWTAVQVFSNGYVFTDRYQLPLYHSKPTKTAFDYLRHYETKIALAELVAQRKIKPLGGASVFVRIADGRRRNEISLHKEPNQSYLPIDSASKYGVAKGQPKPVRSLVPKDENVADFESRLTVELTECLARLLAKQTRK
ncbi:uncharacterized protein [Oscarella lobularis]|uniref:uncharacterized protein isoform X2 n=1 Tax=Oscarella lobularis TaxID=121494 RepID=UPI0033132FF3